MFVVTYVRPEDESRCLTEDGDHDYDMEARVRRAAWFRTLERAEHYASIVPDAWERPAIEQREFVASGEYGESPSPYWLCVEMHDVEGQSA